MAYILYIISKGGGKTNTVCRLTNHQIYYCFPMKNLPSIDYQTKTLILNTNVSIYIYIYVLVGHGIKLDKNNRCPKKKKLLRFAFGQLSCGYILMLLSVSMVLVMS